MTHTEKLSLPQWEATDPFQRADFNEAFASLDEGYAAAREDAAEAKEGLATHQHYVIGSYVGTGAEMTIDVGFRPSLVIINGAVDDLNSNRGFTHYSLISNGSQCPKVLTITDTGFTAQEAESGYGPHLVTSGRAYVYLAFR